MVPIQKVMDPSGGRKVKHFSTERLHQVEALPFWRDYICNSYVPVEIDKMEERGFLASGSETDLGYVKLMCVKSTSAQYKRTHRNIKQSDHGEFLLTLLTGGELEFEQAGRTERLHPGDLCLFDTSRPYTVRCTGTYKVTHMKIARSGMLKRYPLAESMAGLRVPGDNQFTRLAGTVITESFGISGTYSARKLGPSLVDLVSLAFEEHFCELGQHNSRYTQTVARANMVIADNLFNPMFEISNVAAEVGVSSRTLNRAFAKLGTTPSKYLLSKRLEAAREMIETKHVWSVAEVAMACGFNDFSHFSRVFKSKFGMPPSAMLRQSKT